MLTAGPQSAKSPYTDPPPPPPVSELPPADEPRNISTLIAIRTYVAVGSTLMLRRVRTGVRWREQSGQRMPTGVAVMQSGQIGLPQLEHETPVSRLGWR